MTAALSELHPPGGWTTDDLDELPEDGHRYEIIDGALMVSPSPTSRHQKLVVRLDVALEPSCPPQWAVSQGVEVRISRRRSLTPDVLVVAAEAAAREPSKFAPEEVVLVAEVYVPTGPFDKVIEVDEPWEIRLPIREITPRFYRPQAEG